MRIEPLKLLGIVLVLLVGVALSACHENDSPTGPGFPTPTPTATPGPFGACPFTIATRPLEVAGAWFVKADPPGSFTIFIGTQVYGSPDEGMVVYGSAGDTLTACRPCGCSFNVPLR